MNKQEDVFSLSYIAVKELRQGYSSPVILYLTQNYMNSYLTASFMSEELGISEENLNLEIKKVSRLTFKPFLNQIRIVEAKRLLAETNYRVVEVSQMVGYENVTHFNRVFKKEVLCSPSVFRKQRLNT